MKYTITQAELCEAVQLYLNEHVLKRPVKVAKVERPSSATSYYGVELENVEAYDDQQQVAPDARAAAEASS